jgi:hypothetical protein
MKKHYGRFLIAALALIPVALLAQTPAPTPPYSGQVELSKVEEWVLSQGTHERKKGNQVIRVLPRPR